MNKEDVKKPTNNNGEKDGKTNQKFEKITPKMGRPRKFNNADDLFQAGCDYINERLEKGLPLTVTGLCIALGTSKDVINDYESGKYNDGEQDYSYPIKRLKLFIEDGYEQKLHGNNPTGAIFGLKNFGWKDTQNVTVNEVPDKLTTDDIAELVKKKKLEKSNLKAVK